MGGKGGVGVGLSEEVQHKLHLWVGSNTQQSGPSEFPKSEHSTGHNFADWTPLQLYPPTAVVFCFRWDHFYGQTRAQASTSELKRTYDGRDPPETATGPTGISTPPAHSSMSAWYRALGGVPQLAHSLRNGYREYLTIGACRRTDGRGQHRHGPHQEQPHTHSTTVVHSRSTASKAGEHPLFTTDGTSAPQG